MTGASSRKEIRALMKSPYRNVEWFSVKFRVQGAEVGLAADRSQQWGDEVFHQGGHQCRR
jgi:hypothetical protein